MSVLDTPDLVPVPLGYCPCEGHPHADGDSVYLAADLSMAGGMAAQGAIADAEGDTVKLQELLARVWVNHGVQGWTFLDDDGKPIPFVRELIPLVLPYAKGGRLIAEKADALYAEAVTAPLEERLRKLEAESKKPSPPGSTPSSLPATSHRKTSPRKRR